MVIEDNEKIQGVEDKNLEWFQLEMLFNTDIKVWHLYNRLQNCKTILLNKKIVLCICRNESSLKRTFNEIRCRCYDNDDNFMADEEKLKIYAFNREEIFIFKTINELEKNTDGLRITDVRFFD